MLPRPIGWDGCIVKVSYGAEVIDSSGKVIGTVDYVARNTLTGEITKFIIMRKGKDWDLFVVPEDVLEVTDTMVKLKITGEDLVERSHASSRPKLI